MENAPVSRSRKFRRYMRFKMETWAKVHIETKEGETLGTLDLLTTNVCAGGAFFQMTSPLSGGTRVRVELKLASEKHQRIFHVLVRGTVLRSVPDGIAVGFDDDYEIVALQ
jgi:hypothetical protein